MYRGVRMSLKYVAEKSLMMLKKYTKPKNNSHFKNFTYNSNYLFLVNIELVPDNIRTLFHEIFSSIRLNSNFIQYTSIRDKIIV